MAMTVALLNMKGGVGKSTLAVNLVWEYSTSPWHMKVLLVDLDPQFNASQYLLGQADYVKAVLVKAHPTVWDIFEQNTKAPGRVSTASFDAHSALLTVQMFPSTGGQIDLIASRLELALSLRNPAQKETLLARSVSQIAADYDLIVIDCPPTESVLTSAAYLASDQILVPVKPEYLSSIGLPLLRQSLNDFGNDNPSKMLHVAGIVFNATTGYSPEELKAKAEVSALARSYKWPVFASEVPYSRSFPKGAREGMPIFLTSYARTTTASRFQGFAREFAKAVGL
jgi:chromosome partitioning protein